MDNADLLKTALNRQVEGINIINDHEPLVGFQHIKRPKSPIRDRTLDKWVVGNFVSYMQSRYKEHFRMDWGLRFSSSCNEVTKLKDSIVDMFGFCDNIILKDYVDYFFDQHIDYYMKTNVHFYISFMRQTMPLERFYESYSYKDSVDKGESNIVFEKRTKKGDVEEGSLEASYVLGLDRLLMDFGVVVAVNWLHMEKKKSKRDIARQVMTYVEIIKRKGSMGDLERVTAKFSPYPDDFEIKNFNSFFNKFGMNVDIEFTSNNKFDFKRGTNDKKN